MRYAAWLGVGLCILAGVAAAQGTTFTYQGRLVLNGNPATGTFDLQFRTFTALTGGSAVSPQVTVENVPVQNGLFAVEVPLGAGVFNGFNRWLQIWVRPGSSTGAYTALSPRQRIQPAPYAIYSGNANLLDNLDATAFAPASHTHSFSQLTSPPLELNARLPNIPALRVTNTSGPLALFETTAANNGFTGVRIKHDGVATALSVEGGGLQSAFPSVSVVHRGRFNTGVELLAGDAAALSAVNASGFSASVFGYNSAGDGIIGRTESDNPFAGVTGFAGRNANGVVGKVRGAGVAVFGQAGLLDPVANAYTDGQAGRFDNLNPQNARDTVELRNTGTGYSQAILGFGPETKGLRIATGPGATQPALNLQNGTLVLTPQEGFGTGSAVTRSVITILANDPIKLPLSAAGLIEGTSIWLVNGTAATVQLEHVRGGAVLLPAHRARQFLYLPSLEANAPWVQVE